MSATGFTVLVGENYESLAPIYNDVVGREIFADLRERGHPLPTNDLWVTATAVRAGAVVLTFDTQFEAITRVGSLILRKGNS